MTDTTWELPEGADRTPPPEAPEPISLPETEIEPAAEIEPDTVIAPSAGNDVQPQPEQAPAPQPELAAGIVPMAVPAKPKRTTTDLLFLLAAGVLLVGALSLAGFLLPHTGTERVYDLWPIDALFGVQAAGIVAAAVLLLLRRTRDLAAGLVLGALPLWFADEIDAYRPSTLLGLDIRASGIFFLVASGLFVVGLALVLSAVLVGRSAIRVAAGTSAAARRPSRAARTARLYVLLAGFVALVCYITGRFMSWESTTISLTAQSGISGQPPVTESCCSIGAVGAWTRVDYFAALVVLLGVVVAATAARSRIRGAGLLFGGAFLLATGILETTVGILSPLRSNTGLAQIAAEEHLKVTSGPLAGYWIAVLGVVLVLGAAVLRLALNPDRVRYPQAPTGA